MRVAVLALAVCFAITAQTPSTLLRRAIAEHERGDLSAAVRDYRQVLHERPALVMARTNMAAALAALGRFDEAIQEYRTALAQDPNNVDIRMNLALAWYSKGDAANAAREYETLHREHPENIRIATLLAECQLRTGNCDSAIRLIEPLAATNPRNPDITYLHGLALIRTGRPEEGLPLVEGVAKQTGSADAFLLAGATQLNLGRIAAARESLEKAVQLNSKLDGAFAWLGLARDRAGDEDGAKAAFLEALKRNSRDFDANLHLAAVLYRNRDYEAANFHIQQALQVNPESPMARYAAALLKAATGKTEAAVSDLEKIVRDSPEWLEPRVKLSSLYFKLRRDEDGKRQQAAVERLNKEHRGKSSPFEK